MPQAYSIAPTNNLASLLPQEWTITWGPSGTTTNVARGIIYGNMTTASTTGGTYFVTNPILQTDYLTGTPTTIPVTITGPTYVRYEYLQGTGCFRATPCEQIPRPLPERLREIMASRMAPKILKTKLQRPQDAREQRARETLQRVIGKEKYQQFLVRGHVTVRAKSGLTYQIFPGHGITNVYNRGKKVERLCVVLKSGFPPTDSLIVRYLMILNNEDDFKSYAVKHGVGSIASGNFHVEAKQPTLAEIYKTLKPQKVAA